MSLTFLAYPTSPTPAPLVPASRERDWMQQTQVHFANRCLPLRLANEAGWVILNDSPLSAIWTGGNQPGDLLVTHDDDSARTALSHFGEGVLTWHVPYLFRTPTGIELLARGPANWPKDAITPLEGLIESEWSPAPFTMNWKFTRPGIPVRFERGEPICMVVPQSKGLLNSLRPAIVPLEKNPALAEQHRAWCQSRAEFLNGLRKPGATAGWEQHYFRGTSPGGATAPDHRTRLALKPFLWE